MKSPEPTPASILRNVLQEMYLAIELYDRAQARVPVAVVIAWSLRLRQILLLMADAL